MEFKKMIILLSVTVSIMFGVLLGMSCYGDGYKEPSYLIYTVKRGDNLYNIARSYGVSVDSIVKLNNLNSNSLSIGQKLKIKEV